MWVRGLKHKYKWFCFSWIWSHPVWVRGLKPIPQNYKQLQYKVAPRVGAWIETDEPSPANPSARSHPVWVRGLKHVIFLSQSENLRASHPVWVRGLKLLSIVLPLLLLWVAPRVGAWIETNLGTLELLDNPCRTPCGCVD